MSTALISLKNVALCYRKRRGIFGDPYWALKDVSFTIYQGETLGVIGRNGAGKSTLMRLLAGIVKPDRGELHNGGYSVSLLALQLGFVPTLSGRENALLSGMFMGMRRKEIEAKLPAVLEFSELGEFFERPINTYSAGMKARLGFSVALQVDPDVLLIDEVLGVGDAVFGKKSTQAIHEKIRSKKTVVFVSHNGVAMKQLCDRVVWIENGITRMEGPAAEVIHAYHLSLQQSPPCNTPTTHPI